VIRNVAGELCSGWDCADREQAEFVTQDRVQGEVGHGGAEQGVAQAEDPVPQRICSHAQDAASFSLADAGCTTDPPPARREWNVSLPVSKATIASRLSLRPEYFSRVLHEHEAEGLIAIDKRDIRILDAQRLARHTLQ
jgi:CRP-like cAMP-binding protein